MTDYTGRTGQTKKLVKSMKLTIAADPVTPPAPPVINFASSVDPAPSLDTLEKKTASDVVVRTYVYPGGGYVDFGVSQ